MENKIVLILIAIILLIAGGVIGYTLGPEVPECEKPEVCVPEIIKTDCPDVICPEIPECSLSCVCPVCDEDKEEVKDQDLREEVSDEYGVPAYILKSTRTCSGWIDSEKDKGNIDEKVEESPFCWEKDGKFDRTIARIIPQDDGCKIAYLMNC